MGFRFQFNESPAANTGIERAPVWGIGFILACAYAAWELFGFPWISFYELNPDEGYNLGKAALVHSGYKLYGDIWSDQPPVLTYVLAALQHWFPWNVTVGRLAVLGFSMILLTSLFVLVSWLRNRRTAVMAVVLLMAAPMFIRLSVSVMIGLPSLALAMASLAVYVSADARSTKSVVLSGLLFALSLQTKFFSFLWLPAALLLIGGATPRERRWRVLTAWVLACLAGLLMVTLLAGEAFVRQLIQPHVSDHLRHRYQLSVSAMRIGEVLLAHWLLLVPALVGAVWMVWSRGRHVGFLWTWVLVPGLGLLLHTPVWDHHILLMLIPMSTFAAIALVSLAEQMEGGLNGTSNLEASQQTEPTLASFQAKVLASVILLGWPALSVSWALLNRLPDEDLNRGRVLGELVEHYASPGSWVVTDSPLDAFRAGLLVPPELVVFSAKRFMARQLSADQVLQVIQKRHPQQVSFRRFRLNPLLTRYLDVTYLRTHEDTPAVHYVLPAPRLDPDTTAEVTRHLSVMVNRFASTSVNGAYAGVVTADGLTRYGETPMRIIDSESAYMRPPGSTPRVGACMVDAYRRTGDRHYLALAEESAKAVIRVQDCTGGWKSEAFGCGDFQTKRQRPIAFDEGMIGEAVGLLLEVAAVSSDRKMINESRESASRALNFLVVSQNSLGAWPYSFGTVPYARHSTLNDRVTTAHIRALFRGWEVFRDVRYLEAAIRGVTFLLDSQVPPGGWAQQYDDRMQPAQGRSFEPAALASIETADVIKTLVAVRSKVSDHRVDAAIGKGGTWLESVMVEPNRWARFYDVQTQKPIFQDRQGRRYASAAALPAERRDNYRWEGRFESVIEAIELARAVRLGDDRRVESVLAMQGRLRSLRLQSRASDWLARLPEEASAASLLEDENRLVWTEGFVARCEQLNAMLTQNAF